MIISNSGLVGLLHPTMGAFILSASMRVKHVTGKVVTLSVVGKDRAPLKRIKIGIRGKQGLYDRDVDAEIVVGDHLHRLQLEAKSPIIQSLEFSGGILRMRESKSPIEEKSEPDEQTEIQDEYYGEVDGEVVAEVVVPKKRGRKRKVIPNE